MIAESVNAAIILLILISEVSLGLAGPPRHKHEVRDVPSALTSTQTEDETTYYTEPTETYTSLPPFWPPRPTPRSSTKSTFSSVTTPSPEYPYNTPTDTTTTSWDFPTPNTSWNFTIPNTTWTGYPVPNMTLSTGFTVTHFNLTTTSSPYFTWSEYSDTWGDHNTYPTPSSPATVTTTSVIKTLTSLTATTTFTTVVSKTVSLNPPPPYSPRTTSSKSSFTFKTTPFANLTTFTSPRWTTVPVALLTGSPFCSNAADPDAGIGNHCVCKNGQTVGVIPFSKRGDVSDYQPCAYTTVGN